MIKVWKPGDPIAHIHDDVPKALARDGYSPDAIAALLDFDTANFHHHRAVMKGELVSAIIGALGLDLDLAQFQGMTAILRIRSGVGRPATEPTIGRVAEEMAIDPSRASRIVSDLVAKGFVERQAAQDDGRKSVLSPTEAGYRLLREFRLEKWKALSQVFRDWRPEDIAAYARAIRTYSEGMQAAIADLRARRTK
jgi:DNA-binding MarR family transcriptional regulator